MDTPSIEGTYQLVRRELPDGTMQEPPLVMGMMSFTKEFRNFSVLWYDDQNRFYSECYVARYLLTEREYTETSQYLIVHDQIGGKDISYDLSRNTESSPVSRIGTYLTFDLPQAFEKALSITVEFRGDDLTATGKGLFVDHWKRVE